MLGANFQPLLRVPLCEWHLLTEAGEVTLGVAGVGGAESVFRADAANGFSVIVAEQIVVGGPARTAVFPVNMVNVQIDRTMMI